MQKYVNYVTGEKKQQRKSSRHARAQKAKNNFQRSRSSKMFSRYFLIRSWASNTRRGQKGVDRLQKGDILREKSRI